MAATPLEEVVVVPMWKDGLILTIWGRRKLLRSVPVVQRKRRALRQEMLVEIAALVPFSRDMVAALDTAAEAYLAEEEEAVL